MAAKGLDFGSAASSYASILREAHKEKQRQEMARAKMDMDQARNAMQAQQSAYLYGFDSPDVNYLPVDGIAPTINRQPNAPLSEYSPENPYPQAQQRMSVEDLIAGLESEEGQQGIANINEAAAKEPTPDPTQARRAGPSFDKFVSEVPDVKEKLRKSGLSKGGGDSERNISKIFDDEIKKIVDAAQVQGLVRDGRVHPNVAKRIRELQDMKVKAALKSGDTSFEDKMLQAMAIAAGKRDINPPQGRAPKDPTIGLQRKISVLRSQLTPRPRPPTGFNASIPSFVQAHQEALKNWELENADKLQVIESLTDQLLSGNEPNIQKRQPKTSSGRKVRWQGKEYSLEDFKSKFPKVYEKNKSKFGG